MKEIIFIFTILIVFSCKKEERKTIENHQETYVIEGHVEEEEDTFLNWEGSYVGILPCEDCEGKNTEVILKLNHTYIKSTLYMKTDKEEVEEKGSFIWLDDGCTLILDDKNKTKIKVSKNKLTVLNRNGKKHKKHADQYILQKNICEGKKNEALAYEGDDGKKYTLTFADGCDGFFAKVKSDDVSLLLMRETASDQTTTYGNEDGYRLIDESSRAVLYLDNKDVELIPVFDKH